MTDGTEQSELTRNVIMLFDSALAQGQNVAIKPNALVMAPPPDFIREEDETDAHMRYTRGIKMRQILGAFQGSRFAPEQMQEKQREVAHDVALWALVGGYCWARDHSINELGRKMITAKPLENGLDKFTAEQCAEIGPACINTILSRFGADLDRAVMIAPVASWNTGKKLFQFEKDGETLDALLAAGLTEEEDTP